MKRNILFGSILAAALSVGVGAQGQMGGAQSGSKMAKGGDDAVTVTGCLQAADGSGTGVSQADPMKADKFVLANAMMSSGAAANSSAAGSESGSGAGGTSVNYALSGAKKEELRAMAKSKVEVTGKIERGASAGTSTNGASSATGTTGSAMSTGSRAPETDASGRTLKVSSIRKIAGTCS
jgi:hypothetical protein